MKKVYRYKLTLLVTGPKNISTVESETVKKAFSFSLSLIVKNLGKFVKEGPGNFFEWTN